MICAGNDQQFSRLATTIGAPSLIEDQRFLSNSERVVNRGELRVELEARLGLDSAEYWSGVLGDAGVPAGPVNDVEGGYRLAESLGLDPIDEIDGIRVSRSPIRLSATPAETRSAPPGIDEQGKEIRAWLKSTD